MKTSKKKLLSLYEEFGAFATNWEPKLPLKMDLEVSVFSTEKCTDSTWG